jgi:hypothetical protein
VLREKVRLLYERRRNPRVRGQQPRHGRRPAPRRADDECEGFEIVDPRHSETQLLNSLVLPNPQAALPAGFKPLSA